MAITNSPHQELIELSTAEIDQLSGGRYNDFDIMDTVDDLNNQDGQIQDIAKKLALLKLTWRSPEVHDWFAYEKILLELINEVVEQENGKELLYWALVQVVYDAHHGQGLLAFDTYWNYARGFLYIGHARFFSQFLDALLAKTALPNTSLTKLIGDAARLGAPGLARELQALGKKRYGEEWQPFSTNELLPKTKAPETDPLIDDEGQAAILASLSEDSFADVDEDIEMEFLLTSEESFKQITEDIETEALLLMVPDMIWFIFRSWEENREGCLIFLEALKFKANVLPELSILGDLLADDGENAFIFDDFGKIGGFNFDSVKSFALNPEYNIYLRTNAAKALMQIPSKVPRHRSQVINILDELLISQKTNPKDDEIMSSFLAADVLDTDLYELKPAINQVFKENRVDPQVVGLESYTANWTLDEPVPSANRRGKSILLKCQQCERSRFHPYEVVFYDISMRGRKSIFTPLEIFLDHPIVCPLCGARDFYTIAFQSMLRLIPPNFFGDADGALTFLDEVVYLLFSERLFMDGLTPFLFSSLRKKVIDSGIESLNALERGEYTRVTGKFQESLQALRQSVSDNPESHSGTLALAMAEHDYGDQEKAIIYYHRSLGFVHGNAISKLDNPRYTAALQGLQAIKEGKKSPYLYPINKYHKTLLDQQSKKERNRKRH